MRQRQAITLRPPTLGAGHGMASVANMPKFPGQMEKFKGRPVPNSNQIIPAGRCLCVGKKCVVIVLSNNFRLRYAPSPGGERVPM